ncbi:MAG: 50S ribosomal protein L35ae [Candidatus Lokiarchaeota archaeon]|nr:50S ribosomal protein L35ae [Candidatus Lokiarchaeota archaeon]
MAEVKIKKGLKGRIMNYRRARHHQYMKHVLIKFPDYDDDKIAAQLIGKEVQWETRSGKILRGKIQATHGKNGVVRAIFDKSMPGESLGTEVTIRK